MAGPAPHRAVLPPGPAADGAPGAPPSGGAPPRFRIHLGAHKTASTHFQALVAANADWLCRHDVHAVPMETLRAAFTAASAAGYRGEPLPDAWEAFAGALPPGGTVLLSDENILGEARTASPAAVPYPKMLPRLLHLLELLGLPPDPSARDLELMLAIRAPGAALLSAWKEGQRWRALPDFATWLGRARRDRPYWLRLVERLRDALPGVPVTLWTYEAYAKDPAAFLPLAAGLPPQPGGHGIAPVAARIRPSPSFAAIEALRQRRAAPGPAPTRAEIDALLAAPPCTETADPLTPEETAAFAAAYRRDLAGLAALGGVTLHA